MSDAGLAGVVDAYGLTAMQEGMLYHSVADPGVGVYVNQIVTPVSGDLDPELLRASWASVVARHDTLRTAFVWDGLDDPLQVVRAEVEHPWEHIDLTGVPDADRDGEITRILASDRDQGFDLAAAPLSRMLLIRTGDQQWEWVWSFHHLIVDGWSAQVLLDELFGTYRASADGRPLTLPDPPPYRDFVAYYLDRDTEAERDYWTRKLAGYAAPLDLSVPGLPASEGSTGYRTEYRSLDQAMSDDLAALARSHQVTLNTVFVAIWALVVGRWARTKDVVFGTTVAGRPPGLDNAERATGLFINTLPTRVSLQPAQRLGALLNDIQTGQLDDRRHELASLADMQRWSDVPGGESLFESIVVFENYPPGGGRRLGDSITLGPARHIEQSNYPVAVLVIPGDEIRLGVVHDRSRFSEAAVDALFAQLVAVARAFIADPDGTLSGFSLVGPSDVARIAALSRGPDLTADPRTVVEMIDDVAARHPDRQAVASSGRSLTYSDLDAASSQLARRLVRAGVASGAPVGLHLPRSADLVVAILGILKAGAAYVPLDPTYPRAHVTGLIEATGIGTIVSDSPLADSLAEALGDAADLVLVDRHEADDPAVELPSVSFDDLAYVIHTSGSTGRPKGVMVSHRSLAASTIARSPHYGEPVGRFLLLSSYAFDSSVAGIFWTLTTGGALVLPEPGLEQDVDALLALAAHEQVTHTLCLPTLYQVLLDHAVRGELASLQVAVVAGEACPAGVLASHLERGGRAELHNEYGPTEATVWCTAHRAHARDVGRALPIGRPIAGAEIHLLDAYGNRVPLGFAGELCVSGAGVALGYFGRPDLTAERFLTIDIGGQPQRIYRTGDLAAFSPEGTLSFLGRTDQQLKIRGHRIEAAAIEAELRSHPDVKQAAVMARPLAGRAGAQLVAYAVPSGPAFDPRAVTETLRRALPEYMVPDVLVALESIPQLPNGKLDTASLPDPRTQGGAPDTGHVSPRTPEEALLADIWRDLLGVATVGIHDDFFSLGGDSLLAIRVTSAIRREFGKSLPLASLVRAPTLAALAGYLEDTQPENSVLVPMSGTGPETLYLIHPGGGNVLVYQPLSTHLPDSIRVVGVQAHGVDGIEDPDSSVHAMTERYAEAICRFQPTGAIHLAGHSTGGLIAFELARKLREQDRTVGLLAILDTTFPIGRTRGRRVARYWDTIREGRWRGLRTVARLNWVALRINAGRARHGRSWRKLQREGTPLPPDLAGKRINHIALRLQSRHEPGEYDGRVTYVRAADAARHWVQASPRLWGGVATELDVRDAPGYHTGPHSIMAEPNVQTVARIIADELGSRHELSHPATSRQPT